MINVKPSVVNLNPIFIGTDAVYTITYPDPITGFSYEADIEKEVGREKIGEFVIDVDEVNKRITLSVTDTASTNFAECSCVSHVKQTDADGLINVTHILKFDLRKP